MRKVLPILFALLFAVQALTVSADVYADGYCLVDMDTLAVLSQSDAHEHLPMASTTKIMTAIVALENGDIDAVVTIPKQAVGVEGSSVYLKAGEKLTLEQLLYAVMLQSANDAATAVAIEVGGSEENFVAMMNDKAAELGMKDTCFANPHGLPDDSHFSSAYDMAVLMSYAMGNSEFRKITSTENKNLGERYISNHNKLLWLYEYCTGGKTGFTKKAGRCLVSSAEKDGARLACVTLGAPNDWNDHKELFNYGFSLYTAETLCAAGEREYRLPVVGSTVQYVSAVNTDAVSASLLKDDSITFTVELDRFLYAPVSAGDSVGRIVFYRNGRYAGESNITATESAEYYKKPSLWDKIKSLFD